MSKWPTSKYAGLGSGMAAEVMICFWFGIGVIFTIRVVDGLNCCVGALMAVAVNEVTTKMAEQTQLKQVMMKDPKKVEVGKRLVEYNDRKRKELAKA